MLYQALATIAPDPGKVIGKENVAPSSRIQHPVSSGAAIALSGSLSHRFDSQHPVIPGISDVNIAGARMREDPVRMVELRLNGVAGHSGGAFLSGAREGEQSFFGNDEDAYETVAFVSDEDVVIVIYPEMFHPLQRRFRRGVFEKDGFAVDTQFSNAAGGRNEKVSLRVHGLRPASRDALNGIDDAGLHLHNADGPAEAAEIKLRVIAVEAKAGDPIKVSVRCRAAIAREPLHSGARKRCGDTRLRVHPLHGEMEAVRDEKIARCVGDEVMRRVKTRERYRSLFAQWVFRPCAGDDGEHARLGLHSQQPTGVFADEHIVLRIKRDAEWLEIGRAHV